MEQNCAAVAGINGIGFVDCLSISCLSADSDPGACCFFTQLDHSALIGINTIGFGFLTFSTSSSRNCHAVKNIAAIDSSAKTCVTGFCRGRYRIGSDSSNCRRTAAPNAVSISIAAVTTIAADAASRCCNTFLHKPTSAASTANRCSSDTANAQVLQQSAAVANAISRTVRAVTTIAAHTASTTV